jgi:hypothetical protein
VEVKIACLALGENPIKHESMEVDVEVQAPTEALDDGDTPGLPVRDPAPPRLLALKAKEYAHEDTNDAAAEGVIPGE